MRAYLLTTGTLFALIVLLHAWRMAIERGLLRDPWYWLITAVAAALSVWSFRLLRRPASAS